MSQTQIKHSVFVLSLFDTGLATLHGFVNLGLEVVGLDFNPDQPGFRSKFGKKILCPNPLVDSQGLCNLLIKLASKESAKPILIPASDLYAVFISQNRQILGQHFLFHLPDDALLNQIANKSTQALLAEAADVGAPRSVSLLASQELPKSLETLKFPVFIKPCLGFLWQKYFHTKGTFAQNYSELSHHLKEIRSHELNVVVQEFIPGPVSSQFEVSAYVDRQGELKRFFVMQKLRQFPAQFGTGSAGVSVERPELINLTMKFMRQSGLTGMANIEFKQNPLDDSYHYIETNPRVWQQISLAEACQVSFCEAYYQELTGQYVRPILTYKYGSVWIDPISDLFSKLSTGRYSEVKDWMRAMKTAAVTGIFTTQDLRPGLYMIGYGLKIPRLIISACLEFLRARRLLAKI